MLKKAGQPALTFPGGQPGAPRDWDFYAGAAPWQVLLVAATAPLPLSEARTDHDAVEAKGIADAASTDYASGALARHLVVAPPKAGQPAPAASPAALRAYLGPKTAGRTADLANPSCEVV